MNERIRDETAFIRLSRLWQAHSEPGECELFVIVQSHCENYKQLIQAK